MGCRKRSSAKGLGASLCLCLVIALTAAVGLDAAPSHASGHAASAPSESRQVARQIFDVALLRPLQLVQVVVNAAVFLPAYPVGLLVGEGDYVMETCIREPVDRAFRRPLGAL